MAELSASSYLHFLKDGCAVVGHNNVSVRAINKSESDRKYLTSILSIPLGPREVLIKLATVLAAIMFA